VLQDEIITGIGIAVCSQNIVHLTKAGQKIVDLTGVPTCSII
jgi:hypothetical protein